MGNGEEDKREEDKREEDRKNEWTHEPQSIEEEIKGRERGFSLGLYSHPRQKGTGWEYHPGQRLMPTIASKQRLDALPLVPVGNTNLDKRVGAFAGISSQSTKGLLSRLQNSTGTKGAYKRSLFYRCSEEISRNNSYKLYNY
jgi:hypothetical protein